MKKVFIAIVALLSVNFIYAQNTTFIGRDAQIYFYCESSLERIEATNNKASSGLNSVSGDFVFELLVKSFRFEKALMEEHFNEKYMESEKFPKARFKGKIVNIATVNFTKDGTYNVDVKGTMTIHGVSKEIATKGTISVKGGQISANAKFDVALKDYNITIPTPHLKNIADSVNITVNANYEPIKK